LWFPETEAHRDEAARAIADHDAKCNAADGFGPLISQHGFGHGFATFQAATLEPQTHLVQSTLPFSSRANTVATEEHASTTATDKQVDAAAQRINDLLIKLHAAAEAAGPLGNSSGLPTGTKDALAAMYREEGGIGTQRKVAPSGE